MIDPGEKVVPSSVAAPAGIPIQLTISSRDGHAHRVVVKLSRQIVLTVPAHGKASRMLGALAAGTYVLEVDGVSGAGLLIGGAPGP